MTITWQTYTMNLRVPFRLSYGVSETREANLIQLRGEEALYWGESTIPPYYGVSAAEMIACWQRVNQRGAALPEAPEEVAAWVGEDGPAPARCALELALYDRLARRAGLPLYRLLELPEPAARNTSFTIAIDTPEAMAAEALRLADFPVLKIKLGSEDDLARLRAVRAARPDARVRIDANAGWTFEQALELLPALEDLDLEMIEQPLDKHAHEAMGQLQARTRIPLVGDESVQTLEDVERLARAGVAGINLKLMKLGGLTPAVNILRRAQTLGLRVMLGCMVETSLGVTAMAHLSGCAEWIDLDSPMLITNDPFDGVQYGPGGLVNVPQGRLGIGALPKPGAL